MHILPGKQRIFYKATGFQEGLVVTVKIRSGESFTTIPEIILTGVGDGIYYFDHSFVVGKFIAIFYENRVKKAADFLNVSTVPGFVNYVVKGE